MSNSIEQLGLGHLTPQERILLADELLASVASQTGQLNLSAAHLEDLEQRLTHRERNPRPAVRWEELEARLRSRG